MNAPSPLLEISCLSKRFPGVRALHEVSLSLAAGEVLAVIGENGAGKSTLMKILAGVERPDAGLILLEGEDQLFHSVRDAMAAGIALIHQELNLADNLSVAANIFLGREPRRLGFYNNRKMREESGAILEKLGLAIPVNAPVSSLSIGHQQMVEIAKALSMDARILILDEPTSSLSQHETDHLFAVIRDLKAHGVSMLYVSHRLGEVKEIADRVLVLRDGENVGELAKEEIEHDRMVSMMVGREFKREGLRTPQPPGEVVLEAKDLRTAAHPSQSLNFKIRAGEVVGLAGLVGAGRTELLETLFGVTPPRGGSLRLVGAAWRVRNPASAIASGVALVPEDRKQQGLVLEMSVRENMSLATLKRDQRMGLLSRRAEKKLCDEMIPRLNIKTSSPHKEVQLLSGGNQQKVALGKWLATRPCLLLLDEPTRGIDVGAKGEIYRQMDALAREGIAVLFVSSEMEEVLTLSDRVLVMHEGRITGELAHGELSEEAVMRLATATG